MMDSLHSLCLTSIMYIRLRMRTHVTLWGREGGWGQTDVTSARPPKVSSSILHHHFVSSFPTCSGKRCFPLHKTSYEENYKDNKNQYLACNDNHIVHHFITVCSFLTKDYLVVLGRWRLRWARWRGERECSVVFMGTSSAVLQAAGACSTARTTWRGSSLLALIYVLHLILVGGKAGRFLDWSLVCSLRRTVHLQLAEILKLMFQVKYDPLKKM